MYKSKKTNLGSSVPIESLYSSPSLIFSSQDLIDVPDKPLYPYFTSSSLYPLQDSKVVYDKSLYSYPSSSLQDPRSVCPSSATLSTPATSSTSSTSKKIVAKTPTNNLSSRKGSAKSAIKDPQEIDDEIARKRIKNTDAARRSRQKKVEKMETLEKQLTELSAKNNQLKTRLTILEVEKKGLEEKNVDKSNRISQLENQLTEAHQGIINSSRRKENNQ